jgi:hypothetical protein
MSVPKVEVGQIWVAKPSAISRESLVAGHFMWKRFLRIETVDGDRAIVRTVKKQNGVWSAASNRRTTVRLSRLDGTYHNYGFVE